MVVVEPETVTPPVIWISWANAHISRASVRMLAVMIERRTLIEYAAGFIVFLPSLLLSIGLYLWAPEKWNQPSPNKRLLPGLGYASLVVLIGTTAFLAIRFSPLWKYR